MIKKFFSKDSVLKIASVLIALLVWIYVIYVEDPDIEVTIDDIPVSYAAASLPSDLALTECSVSKIDVRLSGSRSEIMELENEDITASLALSSINESGKYKNVKIDVTASNKKVEIINSSTDRADIVIEDIVSRRFEVKSELSGDMPAGYVVAGEEISVKSVTVKGAESIVDNIKGAYIEIPCDGLTETSSIEGKIYLRDKNGEIVDKNHKFYKKVSLGEKKSTVYVTVGKTNMADVIIKGAEDYGSAAEVTPKTVEIYTSGGNRSVIYTESIKGKKPDKNGEIELKLEVPEDTTVIDGTESVTVKISSD